MDLFNNPLVNNALKALSPEQIKEYKKFGENLYGKIDFNDAKILDQLNPVEESVAYIEQGIKAGLLPEDLSEDEVNLLSNVYGEKWYEKYGFKENEFSEKGLNIKVKNDIENAVKYKINEFMEKNSLK